MFPAVTGRGLALAAILGALAAPACGRERSFPDTSARAAQARPARVARDAGSANRPSPAPQERDWSGALLRDARALHALMLDSHPGAVDPENPGFRAMLDAGLAKAEERARATRDFAGFRWALWDYVARFDDEHVALSLRVEPPAWEPAWPGFFTGLSDDRQVVMTREDDAAIPPIGAELVSCDGRDAATLARENVGAFEGRWSLPAQRERRGGLLFLDEQNPWIVRPATCVFALGGLEKTYPLGFRPIALDEVDRRLRDTGRTFRPPSGVYLLGAGGVWITLSNLNDFVGHKIHVAPGVLFLGAFSAILDDLAANEAALRSAPAIVLDLRGNHGGFSDDWGREMAEVLWGPAYLRARERSVVVEWRASQANLDRMASLLAGQKEAPEPDRDALLRAQAVVDGLSGARARGEATWRDARGEPAKKPTRVSAPRIRAPVYVLTDPGCGGLCLDAVDLWKALGAVHIGRETSADTPYRERRYESLPSGLFSVSVPMAVERGRTRGANEPHRPTHRFDGDIRDTQALQDWVATLPRAGRRSK